MAKAVELYATSENTGFNGSQIILSTNLDGMGARPDIMRNLDFIASVHSTSVNPNSGNTICVWIVNTNQEPHQEVLDERAELEEEVREEGLVGEVFV